MIRENSKLLIVDDEGDILLSLRLLLKQHFGYIHTEKNAENIRELLNRENFDVIMLDMNFSKGITNGSDGLELLNLVIQLSPTTPVIMMTAYGDIDIAVQAIKDGAMDFVVKPWQNEKLIATVNAACQLRQSKLEILRLRNREKLLQADAVKKYSEIIGISKTVKKLISSIDKISQTSANVLITGENGTGKELVARSIHQQSEQRDKPFVKIDCSLLKEGELEKVLYGEMASPEQAPQKGGTLDLAEGGVLFIDEVSALSFSDQLSLWQGLHEGNKERKVTAKLNMRIFCTSSFSLDELNASQKFRSDLLYLLSTIEVHTPALRDRIEDIPLLTEYFIGHYSKKHNKNLLRLSAASIKKLSAHPWPGNIRELMHAVERAVIMSEGGVLQPTDFNFQLPETKQNETGQNSNNLDEIEKKAITRVLSKHAGNISHAAKELGLTRAALYRRIEKYGL